jgi:ATP-dependent helicase HrpA
VRDQTQAICDAVGELAAEGPGRHPGVSVREREIRDTADALQAMSLRHTEMAPLYSGSRQPSSTGSSNRTPATRRPRDERGRDLADRSRHPVRRRPRPGPHLALQQAPEGAAAADREDLAGVGQPTRGRCGRVADGIAIRLYSEDDFESRPEFTEPEILRTTWRR